MRIFYILLSLFFLNVGSFGQVSSKEKGNEREVDKKEDIELNEVIVRGSGKKALLMKSPQSIIKVDKSYIEDHFSGSLMQTLEKLPGVKAMSIGSGQSKPTIRGLGFNRLLVAENGIKHEGQQWGEDHGLEIDQFAVDEVEIIKGPASVRYGSDAIGGVIDLKNNQIPERTAEGEAILFGRSNNQSVGLSGKLQGRQKRMYYKLYLTAIDYADYAVPADSIQYYSYYIKLKDRKLRNTAGKELNGRASLGWLGDRFRSTLDLSSIYSEAGFFADAHGLEVRLSEIDHDRSSRDINLPYHSVNHLKVANTTSWWIADYQLTGKIAFQKNIRKEFAERVSHGYMPIPPHTTERSFDKNTYAAMLEVNRTWKEQHRLSWGGNMEHQDNKRDGWGFVIPDFQLTSVGVYLFDKFTLSRDFSLTGGLRFDHSHVQTASYHDWYLSPDANDIKVYKERSVELSRSFNSLVGSLGCNYNTTDWSVKAHIGKSFRTPIPKELASDGVNYHIFRYEKGNPDLNPEEAWQFDMGIDWLHGKWHVGIEPYLNYFSNYIYLNPTSDYVEGLQLYHYTQAKVLRWGGELMVDYQLSDHWEAGFTGEYLYARQRSGQKKGYTLPFSPPWTGSLSLSYKPLTAWSGDGLIAVDFTVTGDQNEIVPPEKKTAGYELVNLRIGRSFQWNKSSLKVHIQGQNLFNKKYYNHSSYYRLIDVPEPGRNISVLVGYRF